MIRNRRHLEGSKTTHPFAKLAPLAVIAASEKAYDAPSADTKAPTTLETLAEDFPVTGGKYGPSLFVLQGAAELERFVLGNKRRTTIGRSSTCDIYLPETGVSREHAEITCKDGTFVARDLGSVNRTWVEGRPIDNHVLRHGDVLQIGLRTFLKYVAAGTVESVCHERLARQAAIDAETGFLQWNPFTRAAEREFARWSRKGNGAAALGVKLMLRPGSGATARKAVLEAFASWLRDLRLGEACVGRYLKDDTTVVLFFGGLSRAKVQERGDRVIASVIKRPDPRLAGTRLAVGTVAMEEEMSVRGGLDLVCRRVAASERLGGNEVVSSGCAVEENRSITKSAFMSHGGPDVPFTERLANSLKVHGADVFCFGHDAPYGEKLHNLMRRGVNTYDRVILVCSKASLQRPGVLYEIEQTLEREAREGGKTMRLLPISLDDYALTEWKPENEGLAQEVRARVVADFRFHESPAAFARSLDRLLLALR